MRAKNLFLAAALLTLLASRGAAGIHDDFAAANRAYEEGKFSTALASYLGIGGQVNDWRVSYNIGNCYYKLGRYLSAKYHFLKAQKLNPLEPSVSRNIAMTNRHFRTNARLPEPDWITRARQRLESRLSLDALSVLLLLAVLLFNLLLFRLLTRGRSRKLAYALAFSLLLALILGAYHCQRASALGRSTVAMVWDADAQLRSGPGEDNTVLFTLHPGLDVRIIDRHGDWLQVAAAERIAGWIEKKKLVLI